MVTLNVQIQGSVNNIIILSTVKYNCSYFYIIIASYPIFQAVACIGRYNHCTKAGKYIVFYYYVLTQPLTQICFARTIMCMTIVLVLGHVYYVQWIYFLHCGRKEAGINQ